MYVYAYDADVRVCVRVCVCICVYVCVDVCMQLHNVSLLVYIYDSNSYKLLTIKLQNIEALKLPSHTWSLAPTN